MKILSILTLFFDCLSTLSIFTLSLHDALPIYVFFDGLLLLLLYANGFAQELDTGQSRSQVVMHIRGDSRSFFFDRLFFFQNYSFFFQPPAKVKSKNKH